MIYFVLIGKHKTLTLTGLQDIADMYQPVKSHYDFPCQWQL